MDLIVQFLSIFFFQRWFAETPEPHRTETDDWLINRADSSPVEATLSTPVTTDSQIRGNSRMDCQANGQFSGALPTCEPICNLSFLCFWNSYPFVDLQIDRSCYILFNLRMYDSLTLPDTKIKTKTDADTDKICIEPDGNFHGSLSLSSMNTSTKFCLVVCQCKHTVRPKCYWYSSCIENISEIDVARFQFDAIVCFHFQ